MSRFPTIAIVLLLIATVTISASDDHDDYIRYVWVTPDEDDPQGAVQAVAFAANMVSRASVLIRPVPVPTTNASGIMLRLDLTQLYPRDYQQVAVIWDEFRFDPRLSLLVTPDTAKFAPDFIPPTRVVDVAPFRHTDGKWYNKRTESTSFDVVQLPIGPHDPRTTTSHRYFIYRALSAIQDKGVYQKVYGGLYYRLVGIDKQAKAGKQTDAGKAGQTDEDRLFQTLGVGSKDESAVQLFDRLRSDQRAAVFRSGVTGKPRRVDFLRSLATRDGQSLLSVTHDLRSQDIDVGTHPVMNLLDFKDAAREVIFERANGLHGFALFNAQGVLQDEVPPDVAADYTIPVPHGGRLQPGISCLRCHAASSGWQPVPNDVRKLLSGRFDAFGRSADEADRLAGLYAGDPERRLLPRARDDYASAILRLTGPLSGTKDQLDAVQKATSLVSKIYARYWYESVDAPRAAQELGIPGFSIPPANQLEDPRIAALMAGLTINRSDWDLVYSFVAYRRSVK